MKKLIVFLLFFVVYASSTCTLKSVNVRYELALWTAFPLTFTYPASINGGYCSASYTTPNYSTEWSGPSVTVSVSGESSQLSTSTIVFNDCSFSEFAGGGGHIWARQKYSYYTCSTTAEARAQYWDTTSTYCGTTIAVANNLLSERKSVCENYGGIFSGTTMQSGSEYCVSGSCDLCQGSDVAFFMEMKKQECCDHGWEPVPGDFCTNPLQSGVGITVSDFSLPGCSSTPAGYSVGNADSYCRDLPEDTTSTTVSSSSVLNSSSSGSDEGSSSSGDESSSSEGPYESSSSDSDETSSSSSSNDEISSSSASNVGSSSSTEINSSTSDPESGESSGSESSSSEWFYESSSSGNEETGSSSADAMSSSSTGSGSDAGESSSSSSGDLCLQYPLASVPANPRSACFSYGGKCYKCNDDRGSECANDWLWIYGFNASNVGWWYTEVDCETGSEKTTEEGIGVCPSHPLNKVPSDPQNACFASNGKCYQCNGDRGSECANDWLWIYDFNASNVGWWYEEVDCYNPNGDDGQCPDGSILQKRVAKANGNSQIESVDYSIDFLPSQKYFDVLGRKANHSSKQKRALYTKTPDLKNEQFGIDEIEGGSISGKIKGNSRDFCYKNSSGKWVCSESHSLLKTNGETSNANKCNEILGIDYGYMKKDTMVGGITCAWPDVKVDSMRSGYQSSIDLMDKCCSNGLIKNLITYRYTTLTTLGDNKMFVVSVGYKFSEDNVATEELVEAFQKHENGHYKYNKCVEFDDSKVVLEIEFCGKLSNAIADSIGFVLRDSLVEKRLNEGQHKLDLIGDLFHENFGLGGYSESYTCPVQ